MKKADLFLDVVLTILAAMLLLMTSCNDDTVKASTRELKPTEWRTISNEEYLIVRCCRDKHIGLAGVMKAIHWTPKDTVTYKGLYLICYPTKYNTTIDSTVYHKDIDIKKGMCKAVKEATFIKRYWQSKLPAGTTPCMEKQCFGK